MRKILMLSAAALMFTGPALAADAGSGWGTGGPSSSSTYGGRDPGPGLNDRSIGSIRGMYGGERRDGLGVYQFGERVPLGRYTPRGEHRSCCGAGGRGGQMNDGLGQNGGVP